MKQAYIVMETKLTRRWAPVLLFSCAIWLWSATVLKGQTPSPAILEKLAVYPSVILYNGKIATMDKNLTFHQAMAIRGERIWTLGTNAAIRPLAGPSTEMVDLKGRTVVPGLIDAHTHPHLWALPHLGGKYDSQLDPIYRCS